MTTKPLRLPVVSESAEHLVMGHLMRRNVLTYKAPPGNEGYDLICIHPDPRHQPGNPLQRTQQRNCRCPGAPVSFWGGAVSIGFGRE